MVWNKVATHRNGFTHHNPATNEFTWSGAIAPLHCESQIDSGVFDTPLDFRPRAVSNEQVDGWVATQGDFHYALGKPLTGALAGQDGTVGFGGRQGEHWVRYRLFDSGYLRTTTRALQLFGAPTYDRANLSQSSEAITLGPNHEPIYVETVVNWGNIYPSLPAGEVSTRWRFQSDGVKEYIVINQPAREWIAANRAPQFPASQWFGFIFQFDLSDIPQRLIDGVLKQDSDDVTSTGATELRNATNQLLALLPLDYVYAGVQPKNAVEGTHYARLSKRWFQGTVNGVSGTFLFVGVPVTTLTGLQAGDLVFDPTVTPTITNTNQDGYDDSSAWDGTAGWFGIWGSELLRASSWVVAVAQGATVSTATFTHTAQGDEGGSYTVNSKIVAQAIDNGSLPSGSNFPHSWSYTTNATTFSHTVPTTWVHDTVYSYEIKDVVGEIFARAGWVSGNRLNLVIRNNGTTGYNDLTEYDYSASTSKCDTLSITYTAGGGVVIPVFMNQYRQRRN